MVMTDEQIVARAQAGDREAFGEIVRRWQRRIFALAYGMLGSAEEANDVAQETFFSAYRNLQSFRGEAKVSSWLHRIAVNQCITRQRRQKVRRESPLDAETVLGETQIASVTHAESPARHAEGRACAKDVRQAVGSLPPELRQIVLMKEFEEMTFQEIADALELPLSTVKTRLYTALKQLRMKLEKHAATETVE
ncbi:MAG: sigma-70 family RNA polymerase sigma factor [Pyrinomonadaceae bacterium]|nr:sigma-70 family RNA polymerase sigma factor [Pyrinomonadaceae bacterium]